MNLKVAKRCLSEPTIKVSAKLILYHLSPPLAFLSSIVILNPSINILVVIIFVNDASFKFGEKLKFILEKSNVTNFDTPLMLSMLIFIPILHKLT